MQELTAVEIKIIRRLASNGGSYNCLLQLAKSLDLNLPHTYSRVKRLEKLGIVKVERNGKGIGLQITLTPGAAVIPDRAHG